MKKQNIFLLILLLALCSMLSFSQIPRTLSYQGVLTDSLGNPKPDNTYIITFRLYNATVSGYLLWTEEKSLETTRGLFHTILGDQVPIPDSLKFDTPYWLSLQIASEPELLPRIPLTAVGYSLYSIKSDTAEYALSSPPQPFVDSSRISGSVPDNSITSLKILDGTIQTVDVEPSFKSPLADTADFSRVAPLPSLVDSARIAGTVPAGSITNTLLADNTITAGKIQDGQIVRSINQVKDNVVLTAEGGATVTSTGDTIVIHAGAGSADTTGIFGIQTTNNTLDILNPSGPTVTVNVKNSGIGTTQLADNSVTSAKISNGVISFADIGQNSASVGEVMKWSGTAWSAEADNMGTNTSGWTDNGTVVGLTTVSDTVAINSSSRLGKLNLNGDLALTSLGSVKFGSEDNRITATSGDLRIVSEDLSMLTTGNITFGHYGDETWIEFDNANKRVGIGTLTPLDRLHVVQNVATAGLSAIKGVATPTTVSNNGVYGESMSSTGYGLYGKSPKYGVYGLATGNQGRGVVGEATGTANIGVQGIATNTSSTGVWGEGANQGIYGFSSSTTGKGVYGKVTSANGYSGYFEGGKFYVNGNVGIGTESPSYPLYVSSNRRIAGYFTSDSLSNHTHVLYSKFTGTGNSMPFAVTGDCIPADGYGYGVSGVGGYIGVLGNGVGGASNTSVYGVRGMASGTAGTRYGIYGSAGGGSTNYAIYASGDLAYTGNLINASDIMFKQNINSFSALNKITQLAPKIFSYAPDSKYKHMNLPKGNHFGLIAEELEKVFPELISENVHPPAEELRGERVGEEIQYKGVNYIELVPILVQAVKEQQELINQLTKRIEEIERK
ncbi:MAG: tail fiber domain-containing protein [Ignavibacteriales bacterium]|nr:tail fiber domain-containing protein [Ignavibacteriales bacterium]